MSLYLTYRPKTFAEMVGQRHIVDILLAQARQQQFSQSYLLYGPRGTGKTSTARLLAKIVNCTTFTADGMPDLLNDPQAVLIDEGKTLDFVEIDAASHTGVDNIREEIIDKALYPPTQLKTKVYVIDEVHMLSKGAFNALLKIMEEPRSYLMFVLATTEIHKVPDTIISRCQVFNFKQLSPHDIVARLKEIADHEGIVYEPEGLLLIGKLSQGALRDAIKYLEQVSILGTVTQERVAQFLGVVVEGVIEKLIHTMRQGTFNEIIPLLDDLVERGTDFSYLAKEVMLYIDDHFLEAPEFYGMAAGMIQEIASESKRYPHPVLSRKKKLWKFFEEQGTVLSAGKGEPVEDDLLKVPAAKKEIGPEENSHGDVSKEMSISTDPKKQGTAIGSRDSLMEKLIEGVDNPMIKAVLKKQATIEGLEGAMLTIIVINEQYFHTLQKPEVVGPLEELASHHLEKPVHIKRKYLTKEEFMKQHF